MPEQGRITVSELNLMIAEALRKEPRIRSVSVIGEISGFKHHLASGHWYFALKDQESTINCVMFRQNTLHAPLRPKDGQSIIATGYVDVYPRNGSYQLYVTGIRADGAGDIYARFEALKQKLYNEGLFDPARKKTIPMVPAKVAVITSASGAALQDIYNVSAMRSPGIPIVLIPVSVQGENAAKEISSAIRRAGEETDADVIIVARGGGSAEDLWCFNEECIARAIADSRIPVVSGVGHEIDTTICDLASDVRASTPSNAAEIVFPDRKELKGRVHAVRMNIQKAAENALRKDEEIVCELRMHITLLSPHRRLMGYTMQSRDQRMRLEHFMQSCQKQYAEELRVAGIRMNHAIGMRKQNCEMRLIRMKDQMKALNPLGVLDRGYALICSPEGTLLTRKKQAESYERMRIRFADGEIEVENNGRERKNLDL